MRRPQLAWDGLGTDPAICCASGDSTKFWLLKFRSMPMSSTTRRRRSTSRKCRGSSSLAYHTADIQYLFPLWHGGPAPPS